MTDPAYLADMAKLHLSVSPMGSAEMQKWLDKLYSYAPATIKRVAKLYGMEAH